MQILSPPTIMAHLGSTLKGDTPKDYPALRVRRAWCEANFKHRHRFDDGTLSGFNPMMDAMWCYRVMGDPADLILYRLKWEGVQ